jgi:hypothetical protein
LGLQWQWHANEKLQWSAQIPGKNYLRLFAFPLAKGTKNLWTVPNLLLQKLPAETFTATTKVKYRVEWNVWQQKQAGLLMMGNDYGYLSIAKDRNGYYLSQVFCKDALNGGKEKVLEKFRLKINEAYLRISVKAPNGLCQFSFSEDGEDYKNIGKPFNAQPDKWIGAKMGLFSTSNPDVRTGGYADFDWFRVSK